jgi:hypothetical protein
MIAQANTRKAFTPKQEDEPEQFVVALGLLLCTFMKDRDYKMFCRVSSTQVRGERSDRLIRE